jgi:hypothetical protein
VTSPAQHTTDISIEGDDIIVVAPHLVNNRMAKIQFESVLGASRTPDGWICPRRRHPATEVVARINRFLLRNGWTLDAHGEAHAAIQSDLERRRSFERTKTLALEIASGREVFDPRPAQAQLEALGWNVENRQLRAHQVAGLAHGLTAINVANFSVPGSGKTATTLSILASHLASGTVDMALVVGPLSSFRPWETETRAALGSTMSTRRVHGPRDARRVGYENARPKDILLLSYATAAADRNDLIALAKRLRVMLIVDESHRVKRFRGGYWAPALVAIAHHARVRMILSGTPMPQSGRDLYTQLRILWPSGELTGSRGQFGARVDGEFRSVLAELAPFVSRTPKAALGLRPYRLSFHTAPLEGTQAEIYDLIENDFRRRIQNADSYRAKVDGLRRGRPIRLLQAASNPDLLNKLDPILGLPRLETSGPTLMDRLSRYRSSGDIPAKSTKALELLRPVVQSGGKAVVWSNFVLNLDQFTELARQTLNIPCFQIDGRIGVGDDIDDDESGTRSQTDIATSRERIIEAFLQTVGSAVLVTNPASCSESISLHKGCHNAVYLDRTYDCALFLQSIDRIHRLGLAPDTEVNVHVISATIDGRPTIDALVDASLRRKEAVMTELLQGAELHPLMSSGDVLTDTEGTPDDIGDLMRFLLGEDSPHGTHN